MLTVAGVKGHPHRTDTNELSILAVQIPTLLSRCWQSIPETLRNEERRARNKHITYLVDRSASDILRLRSELLKFLRRYFTLQGFTEVQTPILAAEAGGALARSFQTVATEFEDRRLSLRIAPELWLKKLVIGGFDKIFEIGPSFRNEGSIVVSYHRTLLTS